MTISGWSERYSEILKELGYDMNKDYESAIILDSVIKKPISINLINKVISGKSVFIVGAGPSISLAIPILKKFPKVPIIVADSALEFLVHNKIKPKIVVTDLDGNTEILKKAAKKSIMIVHAHGDNINLIHLAEKFTKCLGTTQTKEFGNLHNFGGFTDGDRCVFFANYFHPKNIILFGMDFGSEIGVYSKTKKNDKEIKLKKLKIGKKLLEWLTTKSKCDLFTTAQSIKGFKKICYNDLEDIIIT